MWAAMPCDAWGWGVEWLKRRVVRVGRWLWAPRVRLVWSGVLECVGVVVACPLWGAVWRVLLYGDVLSQGVVVAGVWVGWLVVRRVRRFRRIGAGHGVREASQEGGVRADA